MRNYGNETTLRLPCNSRKTRIAIKLTLKLLISYIHMYRLYIRTELDVRQQGAAFGSQVRHGRRLQCHPGGQADVEGAFYLWQGGGGRGASYDAVTQIGCKIVLT